VQYWASFAARRAVAGWFEASQLFQSWGNPSAAGVGKHISGTEFVLRDMKAIDGYHLIAAWAEGCPTTERQWCSADFESAVWQIFNLRAQLRGLGHDFLRLRSLSDD
jgi:hypothetical protein